MHQTSPPQPSSQAPGDTELQEHGQPSVNAMHVNNLPWAAIQELNRRESETNKPERHLRFILKNVMSLQCQAREEELFEELSTIEWDITFLNETWQPEKEELWRSAEGHLFCGSGGAPGHCGVALILNEKCKARLRAFQAGSERLCAADVDMSGKRFRFICAYFPHAGYPDAAVEELYSQMTALCEKVRSLGRKLVICGDCNAVVGSRVLGDDPRVVGAHGGGERNSREDWLVGWAVLNRMRISNTVFRKQYIKQWTHVNGTNQRHIDFCLCDWSLRPHLLNAESCSDICIGADHQAVKMEVAIKNENHRLKQKTQARSNKTPRLWGWQPIDQNYYQEAVDAKVLTSFLSLDVDVKISRASLK